MLNVSRLRLLHAVARLGSLTAAAAELNYSTSAVSQQISLLERETGSVLLERHPRGVRLTEPGRLLAEHAGRIVAELRAAEAALTAVNRGQAGRLRFSSFLTANAVLMPRAVAAFQAANPLVALELLERDTDEGLAAVRAHELDLALVYEFPAVPVQAADLHTIPLLVDPLHIILARDHPLARRRRLSLRDLADQRWIQGVHHGSTMNVLPRTPDQVTVRGLVAAGVGVALAPWLTLPSLPPDVVVRPLDEPTLVRTVMAALPAGRLRLPAAEAMVDVLRSVVADLGAQPS